MRKLLIIVMVLVAIAVLSSCQMYRAAIAERGAEASDATLESAMWTICNAIPVGAVKRMFKTEEERDAYNVLCPENVLP